MTLHDLAKKHNTDKLGHGYIEHYAEHFPASTRHLLEIGVAKGASALMWQEYMPDCDIHILDLFVDSNHVSTKWCRKNLFVPHRGDQSDINVLAAIKEQFDIIIDDGSHRADHQLVSFKHLFFNCLVSGGIYAIEDCHCNLNPFYNGDTFVKSYEDTALRTFSEYMDTGILRNVFFNEGETEIFNSLIGMVEILADEKLILIWKK